MGKTMVIVGTGGKYHILCGGKVAHQSQHHLFVFTMDMSLQ